MGSRLQLLAAAVVDARPRPADRHPKGAARALDQGAASVIATDGSKGSLALDEKALSFAPALPIEPVSTLGAGDVFHGALLAAIALGKSMPEALLFANVTAALSCRRLDGRSGVPTRDEVESVVSGFDPGHLTESEIRQQFLAAVR